MITSETAIQIGNVAIVTAVSSLSGPGIVVYFYWYLDGIYVGNTTAAATSSRAFVLLPNDQSRIDVLDSLDPAFDAAGNAPAAYPARRTLFFVRSIDPAIARYRIEQQISSGAWTVIGYVVDDAGSWSYEFLTGRLLDLTAYAWRVIPIDTAGNDGTAITLASEQIVRTPDAPKFSVTFNSGTNKVTFAGA